MPSIEPPLDFRSLEEAMKLHELLLLYENRYLLINPLGHESTPLSPEYFK